MFHAAEYFAAEGSVTLMSNSLFRPEVAKAKKEAWIGTIRIRPPRLGWWSLAGGIASLALLSALVSSGTYTSHQRTSGTLVSSRGVLFVTSKGGGVVTRLWVKEGQHVHRDDAIFEVSHEQSSASLGDTYADIGRQLEIKRRRLTSDLAQESLTASSTLNGLHEKWTSVDAQLAQLKAQVSLQQERAEASMNLYQQWTKLGSSGLVSKLQVLQQHDTTLQLQAALRELTRQLLELRQQRASIDQNIDNAPRESGTRASEISRAIADVDRELAENEAKRAVVIRASGDGSIGNVIVHVGQSLPADLRAASIFPDGSVLRAEFWLPSSAIGFIRKGDQVVLRYEAYPYQKFGQYKGIVDEASSTAIDPATLSQVLGKQISEPQFRVTVRLDAQSINVVEGSRPLMVGMAVNADILLQRRPLIDWVLEPLRQMSSH